MGIMKIKIPPKYYKIGKKDVRGTVTIKSQRVNRYIYFTFHQTSAVNREKNSPGLALHVKIYIYTRSYIPESIRLSRNIQTLKS